VLAGDREREREGEQRAESREGGGERGRRRGGGKRIAGRGASRQIDQLRETVESLDIWTVEVLFVSSAAAVRHRIFKGTPGLGLWWRIELDP
jgi:hypothetical protein